MTIVRRFLQLAAIPAASLALITSAGAAAQTPKRHGFVAPANSLFMVFANPVEGQDVAFNVWYDRHIASLVKLPQFVRAQRYLMTPRKGRPDPAFKYVVVYEIKGDPEAAFAALGAAVKRGEAEAPDPRWVLKTEGMVYRPITELFK